MICTALRSNLWFSIISKSSASSKIYANQSFSQSWSVNYFHLCHTLARRVCDIRTLPYSFNNKFRSCVHWLPWFRKVINSTLLLVNESLQYVIGVKILTSALKLKGLKHMHTAYAACGLYAVAHTLNPLMT